MGDQEYTTNMAPYTVSLSYDKSLNTVKNEWEGRKYKDDKDYDDLMFALNPADAFDFGKTAEIESRRVETKAVYAFEDLWPRAGDFDMNDMIEYEANAFNAHLLIDEDDMDALFRDGYDLAATAKMLKVNINLLLIKIQEMNKLGMNLKMPYSPDARFFRHTSE
jgi:hypothetical protein